MTETSVAHPPILWAQRKNLVYIRVAVEDCKDPEVKIDSKQLYFKGTGGSEKKVFEATLDLFDEIKPSESKYTVRDRGTEFVLIKSKEGPFWKRLLAEDKKNHWVKVDFNKWKDEDSDDEWEGDDFDMFAQNDALSRLDDVKEESSDEDMPELES